MNRNILLLGGAGFIGSHMCDSLITNNNILCIDNLSLGNKKNIEHLSQNKNFKFLKLDILDKSFENQIKNYKIDLVIHLAANSDIAISHNDPNVDVLNTLNTTIKILEFMRIKNIKEIIFASSSAIYGEHSCSIHENIGPLFPHSHYGAAKLASEAFISSYCENYNIKSWIIRFPNVIGERCTHGVIFDFFNRIKKNPSKLRILGDGLQEKPYLYVKELIDAILYCYQNSNKKINFFNVGSNTCTKVNKIAEILCEELKVNPLIEYSGGEKGWIGDIPKFEYDLSKVNALGWKCKMSSNEAVRHTIKKMNTLWMQ